MQRVTITVDDDLMRKLDELIALRGYQNRSEAIRDLARAGLQQAAEAAPGQMPGQMPGQTSAQTPCVAALVYVYDHAKRDLPNRLADAFHDHHALAVSTLHIHLDHDTCMEVTVLKGRAGDVRHVAEHVIAERGVRHGRLVVLPAAADPA